MRALLVICFLALIGCGTTTQRQRVETEVRRGTEGGQATDILIQRESNEHENMDVVAPSLPPIVTTAINAVGGGVIPWGTILQGVTAAVAGGGVFMAHKLNQHENRKAKERAKA